jgi:hypothetical protein
MYSQFVTNQVYSPEDPQKRCGNCGVKRYIHNWAVNHAFDESGYREKWCNLCNQMIHDKDDKYARHYRNCGLEKPFEDAINSTE